jgi:hypothetical protein
MKVMSRRKRSLFSLFLRMQRVGSTLPIRGTATFDSKVFISPHRRVTKQFIYHHCRLRSKADLLAIVGGRVVYATEEHASLAPPQLPVSPDWSPVEHYGGYAKPSKSLAGASHSAFCQHSGLSHAGEGSNGHIRVFGKSGLWSLGCDCFAF